DGQHEAAGARPPERHREAPPESCKKLGTAATITVREGADWWLYLLRGTAKLLQVGRVEIDHGRRAVPPGADRLLAVGLEEGGWEDKPGAMIGNGIGEGPDGEAPPFDRTRRIAIDQSADEAHAGCASRRSLRIAGTARAARAYSAAPYVPGR